jgi:hypothetical protein
VDTDIILGRWTSEEDARLTEVVTELGANSWPAVSALVPGRTNRQCRHRWTMSLDPTLEKTRGKWTLEEDAALTEAVTEFGNDWNAIAALVPGRRNTQCHRTWKRVRRVGRSCCDGSGSNG